MGLFYALANRNSNWVFDEHVSVISKINDRKMTVFIGEDVQNSLPVLLTPQNINMEQGTMFVFSLTTWIRWPSFQMKNISLGNNFMTGKTVVQIVVHQFDKSWVGKIKWTWKHELGKIKWSGNTIIKLEIQINLETLS